MLDPDRIPEVAPSERLSRFVLSRRRVNQQTGLIKPDEFMPHPHVELSVTRDRDATEEEIWQAGRDVATLREKTLFGRGDALAAVFLERNLQTAAAPISGNPNHVNICGYPVEKSDQKLIAQELAANVRFVPLAGAQ